MTRSEVTPRAGRLAVALLLAGAAAPLAAPAQEAPPPGPPVDGSARLWAAPEGGRLRQDSPFAPAAPAAGIAQGASRLEAVVRASRAGTVGALSVRIQDRGEAGGEAEAVVTELYQELDVGAGHFTIGKKVTSWDVAYAYRPLDVVQQERRLAFVPFALEGVPQLAWERFGEAWAISALWANPLQGQRAVPVHDESGAARLFARAGGADLHGILRWSERTGLQAGAGAAAVAGEALELHGSARWQARGEHLAPPARGPDGGPVSTAPPGTVATHDEVTAVAGLTLTPGWNLSFLVEGWLDPGGDTPATWRERRALAEEQRALLDAGGGSYPPALVAGNLAWGLLAFDRPSLLRENVFLRVSGKWGRFEPALDLLLTPEDRGWMSTATASWQGERLRMEGGLRVTGGPPPAAYRLFPAWAMFYLAAQLSF